MRGTRNLHADPPPAGLPGTNGIARVRKETPAADERLASLMLSFACALIETDDSGAIVYENWGRLEKGRKALAAAGRTADFYRLVGPDHGGRLAALATRVLNAGKPLWGDFELPMPGGPPLPVRITAAPIGGAAPFRGLRWVLADRTPDPQLSAERRGLLLQLQQAQKMEAIGTLAAGVAHDFNNILTAVGGYIELARMDAGTEALEGHLEQVSVALGRAKELVAQILAFGRKSKEDKSRLCLGKAAEECLRFLRAMIPATVEFCVRIRDTTSCVHANPIDLQQVLINLVSNAAQAIGSGAGTVEISVELLRDGLPKGLEAIDRGMGLVRLAVADSGCGIAKENIGRIFDPYFTTKPSGKGSGLGLSVVLGIVKRCGGQIRVVSHPGQGSTFEVFLPRVRSGADQPQEAKTTVGGSESILFVDDEPAVREVVKELLSKLGYTVFTVSNPSDALSLFTADTGRFDLVITDQTMPGMTGNDLARRIKALRPGVPVILCSGYSSLFSGALESRLCADLLLKKPFAAAELDRAARSLLSKRTENGPKPAGGVRPDPGKRPPGN